MGTDVFVGKQLYNFPSSSKAKEARGSIGALHTIRLSEDCDALVTRTYLDDENVLKVINK